MDNDRNNLAPPAGQSKQEDDQEGHGDALASRVTRTMMAQEGTARAWGLVLEEVRVGYARVSMRLRPDMINGHRTAHGGMIFALADTAFAYACNSRNRVTVAQQASILFLSAAREGETLVAEARESALSGRVGAYIVDVRTTEGRPVASFQGLSRAIGGAVVETET
jgi:acyl-CoA thioesterase